MTKNAKWIGGAIGALFGGPIGAAVGAGIGALLDAAEDSDRQKSQPVGPRPDQPMDEDRLRNEREEEARRQDRSDNPEQYRPEEPTDWDDAAEWNSYYGDDHPNFEIDH